MSRANRLISFVAALFTASQTGAQSIDAPSAEAIPSPQVQAAFEQAKQGHVDAAVQILRGRAKDSSENSHYLGLLLYSWRQELARQKINPPPPVDWEMDWQRCSALIGAPSKDNATQTAILAEYYAEDFIGDREKSGRKTPRLPGPGRSLELALCWSAVSEGNIPVQECIDREQDLRTKRKLPAFACPPSEPTKASIERYPAVKILD